MAICDSLPPCTIPSEASNEAIVQMLGEFCARVNALTEFYREVACTQIVEEAPIDGKIRGRIDGGWSEISTGASYWDRDVSGNISPATLTDKVVIGGRTTLSPANIPLTIYQNASGISTVDVRQENSIGDVSFRLNHVDDGWVGAFGYDKSAGKFAIKYGNLVDAATSPIAIDSANNLTLQNIVPSLIIEGNPGASPHIELKNTSATGNVYSRYWSNGTIKAGFGYDTSSGQMVWSTNTPDVTTNSMVWSPTTGNLGVRTVSTSASFHAVGSGSDATTKVAIFENAAGTTGLYVSDAGYPIFGYSESEPADSVLDLKTAVDWYDTTASAWKRKRKDSLGNVTTDILS